MTETNELSHRLRFNQIDAETIATLRENAAFVAGVLPGLMDAFYIHISGDAEAAAFFRDRAHMAYARDRQLRHWQTIMDARFDATYVASVTKIGAAHARLGLEPSIYIGGYSFLLTRLNLAIAEKLPGRRAEARKAKLQAAVTKAALLDMDFSISVYLDIQRRERQRAMDQLVGLAKSVADVTHTISSAANSLEATARGLDGSTVATARESSAVAAASQDASSNMQTVASATEQLSGSIREITSRMRQSADFAEGAAASAKQSNHQVRQLQHAANEIGNVIGIINAIAAQTNLLALNATIEAARAGESGRGFAVVAQEVKSLAEQTTRATAEIAGQIQAMQSATGDTAGAMRSVVEKIEQITGISLAIASAVEEQGAATQEIARNVSGVSLRMDQMSQSAELVNRAANDARAGASEVLQVASSLARNGEMLRDAVLRFEAA
jgi:methyl-accepting chemotaxis protein